MLIGYARTSTIEQLAGLEAQERELKAAGAHKLFTERISSVAKRVQLDAAIDYAREGDVLAVTRLDRLARSVEDLVRITRALNDKCVALHVLDLNLDTAKPTGKLLFHLIGSIAEFERSLMLERQREGIAKAKADGKYKGRVPTAKRKAGEVLRLRQEGWKAMQIAEKLGISRASVFRVIADHSA